VYTYTSIPWLLNLFKPTVYYEYTECLPEMITHFLTHKREPFYAMLNVTETHMPYSTIERKRTFQDIDRGNPMKERQLQLEAIEYVDRELKKLLNEVGDADIVITADHAEIFQPKYGHVYQDVGFTPDLFKVPILQKGVFYG